MSLRIIVSFSSFRYVFCASIPSNSMRFGKPPQTMYHEDVSFNSIIALNGRFDLTHNFENIVYNELIYMGYSIYVYNDGKHEIDFIAEKGNKKFYIQAAYSVAEEKAYEREFGAFAKLDNSIQKVVISNDEVDFSTSTVRHIQFKHFLTMPEL